MVMLDSSSLFNPNETGLWDFTIDVLNIITLALIYHEKNGSPEGYDLNAAIKITVELILATDQFHLPDGRVRSEINEVYHCYHPLLRLLRMVFRQPSLLSDDDFMATLTLLLQRRGKEQLGITLLRACEEEVNLDVVYLLLKVGADPNDAVNDEGNTALHLAAGLENQDLSYATARLLLGSGAHLDRQNKAGWTAVDIWLENQQDQQADGGGDEMNQVASLRYITEIFKSA